jgi:hypothetical protein
MSTNFAGRAAKPGGVMPVLKFEVTMLKTWSADSLVVLIYRR